MKKYIKGIYKRSIFASSKGYHVGMFKIKETNEEELTRYLDKTITFTGYFVELNEDDHYIFYGEVVEHPQYGLQFTVSEYERLKPEDKEGIVQFLSSDLFPGIGEKMASSMVDILGDKVLERILKEPECLNLVPKLSYKKQKKIYDVLVKYEESHNVIVRLTELGFSMKDALNIYYTYQANTLLQLEQNMYEMIDMIPDLSFLKLDRIALKFGIEKDDARRIKASILYVCKKMIMETGDTYLLADEIYEYTISFLQISLNRSFFDEWMKELCMESKLILEDSYYYIKPIYEAEQVVLSKVKYLLYQDKKSIKKQASLLKELEQEANIQYSTAQKKAIQVALENHITIITGGPGTGKTTIIKAIVEMYQKNNQLTFEALQTKVKLLAPTGRASKRMMESTLYPATTIHRFLKWNKENDEFAVNERNPDFSELVIIDEVSMIDIELMSHLLLGLTNYIQLVLVGDFNQLPSVGPGEVLKNMIESKKIPMVELDILYRQKEESYIPILAKEIREGMVTSLSTTPDFTFLECPKEYIMPSLKKLCEQLLSKGYQENRVQFMAPMYAGMNGIDAMNLELQAIFNPPDLDKKELIIGDIIYREQDKILQLVNMPEENVFNGDIGIIEKIIPASYSKSKKNEIYVDYDGIVVRYLPKDFSKIKHGFMISIHKSQGSEFEVVVLPISMSYYRMLYRKLIYTGITRAKRKLILIGEKDAFYYAVTNDKERIRRTLLAKKIKEV